MTTLKQATLGAKVKMYLDNGRVSSKPTNTPIIGTVIAAGQPNYIRLGWREGERHPNDAEYRPQIKLDGAYPQVLPNYDEFPYNQYYGTGLECEIVSPGADPAVSKAVPLGKANIGDKVRFFLDSGNAPCRKPTSRYIDGTVITRKFDGYEKFMRVAWSGDSFGCHNMASKPTYFDSSMYGESLKDYQRFEHSVILDEEYDCVILSDKDEQPEPAKNETKPLKDVPLGSKVRVGMHADVGIVLGPIVDRVLVGWPSDASVRSFALPLGVFASAHNTYNCEMAWPFAAETLCEVLEEPPVPPKAVEEPSTWTTLMSTKPGDRVRIYLHAGGFINFDGSTLTDGSRYTEATVLAVSPGGSYRLLGWKTDEQTPIGTTSSDSDYLQRLYPGDWSQYSRVRDTPCYCACKIVGFNTIEQDAKEEATIPPVATQEEHEATSLPEATTTPAAEGEEHQAASLVPLFLGAVMGRMLSNAVAAEPTEIVRVTAPPLEEEAPAVVPAAAEKSFDA